MVGPAVHACAGCGYELDHSVGNRCPECGLAFDRSALEKPPHRRVPGAAALALVVATMQGPIYGVVLAVRSPPRNHPWTWALVTGTHICASFAAWTLW